MDSSNSLDMLNNIVNNVSIDKTDNSLKLTLNLINNYNANTFFLINAFDEHNNIIDYRK